MIWTERKKKGGGWRGDPTSCSSGGPGFEAHLNLSPRNESSVEWQVHGADLTPFAMWQPEQDGPVGDRAHPQGMQTGTMGTRVGSIPAIGQTPVSLYSSGSTLGQLNRVLGRSWVRGRSHPIFCSVLPCNLRLLSLIISNLRSTRVHICRHIFIHACTCERVWGSFTKLVSARYLGEALFSSGPVAVSSAWELPHTPLPTGNRATGWTLPWGSA